MNEERQIKTRAHARLKLAKMMQLEFAGAICSDYKLSIKRDIH